MTPTSILWHKVFPKNSRCTALFQGKKSQDTFKEDVKTPITIINSTLVYNANLTMKCESERSVGLSD